MEPLQAMFNGMSQEWQRGRAETQMTLGKMISALEAMPKDKEIDGLCAPHSYRGYYSDLSFEPKAEKVLAGSLLTECRSAMGKVFEGYKGGDFMMGESTPIWVADYGDCGKKLIGIRDDGTIETRDDD